MLTQRRPRATADGRTPTHFVLLSSPVPDLSPSTADSGPAAMDVDEFRRRGKELVDFVADHHLGLLQRPPSSPVFATSQTLGDVMGDEAPVASVPWERLMHDFSKFVLPGITPWQHPNFHSFFPHGHSFPSVCAELLSAGLGSVSFRNDISPSYRELEEVVMRWMGRLLDLPPSLTSAADSGSLIMGSAGEAANATVVAARNHAIQRRPAPGQDSFDLLRRLVMFCSSEAHLTLRKSAEFLLINLRVVPTDKRGVLCPRRLQKAMEEEKSLGRIPFLVVATIGTTGTCAIDPLDQIGPLCRRFDCWLHVDGAYAGAACVCPEYRGWLKGIEFVDSLVINAHKWLLVHFDCSLVWMKKFNLLRASDQDVNTLYSVKDEENMKHELMHYQVPFGRRFRALKLWLVLSVYGVKGIQDHIRSHIRLAREFEKLISADERFEVTDARAALVCFRLKTGCDATQRLEEAIRSSGSLDVRSASQPGSDACILRFAVCSPYTTSADVQFAVGVIKGCAFLAEDCKVKRGFRNGMKGTPPNGFS